MSQSPASPVPDLALPLVQFLNYKICPPAWKTYDLYLIRDQQIVFYIGQSHCAFDRVWDHILGGIHGHAVVGRFILVNWPQSGHFTVELRSLQSPCFRELAYNLNQAERSLIEQYTPCFNVSLNRAPSPLPAGYLPPNTSMRYLKSFRRMVREAGVAARRITRPQDTEWD